MTPEEIEIKLDEAEEFFLEGKTNEAKVCLKEVLEFDIKNPPGLHLLGQIALGDKNFDMARDLLKETIKLDPEKGNYWNTYGRILNDLREPEEAEKAFQKALDLNPAIGRVYFNLGNIKLNRGDREEGINLTKKSIEINPDLVSSYLTLAKAGYIKIDDFYFQEMERLLEDKADDPQALNILHYSFSYVYQKAGKIDKFFHHLHEASECGKDPESQWQESIISKVKNLKKISTREFLDDRVSEQFKIITPIFIVGMPRSGTTLTDQIFHTHSQCFGGDELQYFSKYLDRVCTGATQAGGAISYPKLEKKYFEQIALLYQKRVSQLSPGTQYISDKMPWNYQLVGMISKIMPWAKIIHIYRDPLDNGFSCYKSPLSTDIEFSTGMEEFAFYRSKYQEIMDFWQETIPDRFINLSYEKLVDQPETELRRVLDYCGLPWEDNLLNFHQTKRQVRTISSDQVNKPLNKSSIGLGMKYKKHLKPMIDALDKYGVEFNRNP